MENFNTTNEPGELKLTISTVCTDENGKMYAYVEFTDGVRTAEGQIPKCEITKNDGFADIEVKQLEAYMRANLKDLQKEAMQVNVFKAFMNS